MSSETERIDNPAPKQTPLLSNMGFVVGGVSVLLGAIVYAYVSFSQPTGPWGVAFVLSMLLGALFVSEYVAWSGRKGTANIGDYRGVVVVGLIWIPLGILLHLLSLTFAGFAFSGAGFYGISQFKKKTRTQGEQDTQKKKGTWAMVAGALILLGAIVYVLYG